MTAPPFAVLKRLVAAAVRSPSAENNQPFTFAWGDGTLTIIHHGERAEKSLDPRFLTSQLTLGCVLESLEIAGDAVGLQALATLEGSPARDGPWARVTFREGTTGRGALAPGLSLRHTDRRAFHGGDPRHPVFARVRAEAARHALTTVHLAPPTDAALLHFCADVEGLPFRHEVLYRDALHWLRADPREAASRGDGVPVDALFPGLPRPPLAAAALRLPGARSLLARSPAPWVAAGLLRRQLGSSAALMLFTTPSPEASALVPVGRALLGAWLRLNEAGFGVQPHSLPSLFVYEELCGDLPSDFDHELMRQGSVTLSRAFGLGPAERPVLLLRAGLAAPFPERARTPRRPLGEVLRSAEATEP